MRSSVYALITIKCFCGVEGFSPTTFLLSTTNEALKQKIEKPSVFLLSKKYDAGEEEPIECYIVKDEDVPIYGDVICTSAPEEFAWFEGVNRKLMKPTDGMNIESEQCVEGSSPNGTPEWKCS